MINKSEFEALNVGDSIETDGLFPNIAYDEPMVMLVAEKNPGVLIFVMLYFNVRLGKATCAREEGGFRWSFDLK